MSVYIPGMEMPNHWRDCIFSDGAARCRLKGNAYCGTTFDCPLVPVPEHGDLIERDKLRGKDYYGCPYDSCMIADIVKNAPTVIPASKEGE